MKNIQQKVLEESVCKTQNLITTSLTFKEDLINYFQNYDKKNIVEVGCAYGYSTMILSTVFKNVFTINDNLPTQQGDNTIFIEKKISNNEAGNGKTIIATNIKIPRGSPIFFKTGPM